MTKSNNAIGSVDVVAGTWRFGGLRAEHASCRTLWPDSDARADYTT